MKKSFTKTLKAEFIKIKRSNILTLGFILGGLIPFLFILVSLFEGEYGTTPVNPDTSYYSDLFNNLVEGFTGFLLPLLIIITASKIAQLDHKNKGWQLMETQPITKASIFFSKFLILVYNVFITLIVFTIALLLLGWIYSMVIDLNENYTMEIPWTYIGYALSRIFIASLAVIALQYVISVLISNFIWSLVIGFGLLLAQLFLMNFDFNLRWFPYNCLYVSGANPTGSQLGNYLLKAEWLSLLYTVLFLIIGYNWYKFKGFLNAFIKKPARLMAAVIVIAVGIPASYFLIKTNTLEPFSKTIIKGTIKSDKNIASIYMVDQITLDTLITIPVVKNSFRIAYKKPLAPNLYYLQFEDYSRSSVFMSSNDSIQIDYKQYGSKNGSVVVTGTRIAENIQDYNYGNFSYVSFLLENNTDLDKPDIYMKRIITDYEDDLKKLDAKITVDNIVPRDDFLEISKQLIAVKYAQYWKDYLKKKALYFPNLKVSPNNTIAKLLAAVNLKNESLLGNSSYITYITDELMNKPAFKSDSTLTILDAVARQEQSVFKDKWLFNLLSNQVTEETSNLKRDSLYHLYVSNFSDTRYKSLVDQMRLKLNKLNIGEPAIDFKSHDASGKEYSLASFNGKFLMLDTWASWCGPCKYQEPYYVRKYEKYKNKNIVFASINVDRKEHKWHEDLIEMNKGILQIRASNVERYMRSYDIQTIPRFLLIAPNGTIANASFTFPSDKNFDALLDAALNVKYD